jgi:protein-disulfide isomerase
MLILGVVAVVGALAAAWALFGRSAAATELIEYAEDETPDAAALIEAAQGFTKGDPDAPVHIIEFGDFQCPSCQVFAIGVVPTLETKYIDAGLARLTYYDFPLTSIHPHAVLAARAARCAGDQDRFWDYHDVLFGRQGEWSAESRATDEFIEYAGMLSMDVGAFEACIQSDRFVAEVSASERLGRELRVGGTPTVFVNGELARGSTADALSQMIDETLARSAEAAGDGS